MNILGIVTEYNPFHNGHLHHLETSKILANADLTVAVMSGHFLQRGLPALFDKWTRAEMALSHGVDLIIELPTIYACASAEYFASGSIALLSHCGATHLCFGSEGGSLKEMSEIVDVLEEESMPFQETLRKALSTGASFPQARALALQSILSQKNVNWEAPNTILGIEYLKAIRRQRLSLVPLTIQRQQAGYHSTTLEGDICSATAIRHALIDTCQTPDALEHFMPRIAYNLLFNRWTEGRFVDLEHFAQLIIYKLRISKPEDAFRYADADPGIWNRMLNAAKSQHNLKGVISNAKTRRYTQTRIQRILMSLLLDIYSDTKERLGLPRYIRILGATEKGRAYLSTLKKHTDLPIITNLSRFHNQDPLTSDMLNYDIKATDIYALGYSNPSFRSAGGDWLRPMPVFTK